ncbi:TetR family transcriptional regulator [Virgisporangium aliadipatigenens]|uniref:TetR family transcriptional regulator n=1 Tax=Virgisporangium aliadipatigenens TaxID=741659 RepID=A0A8J3YJJ7_9ACTN|nr:TetR/AcrR family transcriptional regulator [Virgisporangium aliadipatigenens]GIJ45557.1 TetR family transcriptional regulator [Virgisporangium aliadipatigenens]
MPTERRAADPARTLALLWRDSGAVSASPRGPRQTLTVDRIVDTAIGMADADGLDAVTMRRVAQALDVAPMTLYTYVPDKATLVELMFDRALGAMARTEPAGAHWRDRLTAVAHDNRALYEAHPWIAACSTSRPALGPGVCAKYEYELNALEGLGLADVDQDAALTFLLEFVAGIARAAADARAAARDSAMSDVEWWEINGPLLEKVFDPARYPLATRVGAAAGEAQQSAYNPDHAYRFGLARVLDGLAAMLPEK